jgi:hypothetical protein
LFEKIKVIAKQFFVKKPQLQQKRHVCITNQNGKTTSICKTKFKMVGQLPGAIAEF